MPSIADNRKYTYADYLEWSDDGRWELIDGAVWNMSPAPKPLHQRVLMELSRQVANALLGKTCQVFSAPFDVRLDAGRDGDDTATTITTVVQPDLTVICDPNQIDDRGCVGAPDLVVEVLSESTAGRDEGKKFRLYERFAVKEYWIVNPWDQTIRIYNLDSQSKYGFPRFFSREQAADSTVVEDLSVDLSTVFPLESEEVVV